MMKKLEAITISQDESVHDFGHLNINDNQDYNEPPGDLDINISNIYQKVREEKLTGVLN